MRNLKNAVPGIMRRALVAFAVCCAPAYADVVDDWSRVAVETLLAVEKQPGSAARNLGTVHIAIFEAMNFVEGGYVPQYLVKPPVLSGSSSQAAAAAAAHRVLAGLYPQQKEALDAALARSVAALPAGLDHFGAVITGGELGAIVRSIRSGGRFSAEQQASLKGEDSMQDAVAWAGVVSRQVATSRQTPIERARVYALAALAVDGAHAFGLEVESLYGMTHPCVSCTIDAAVEVILAAHAGAARAPRIEVANIGEVPKLPATGSRQAARSDPAAEAIGQKTLNLYPRAR